MDRIQLLALPILILAITTGCGSSPTIVVGSKNFTEQLILGELIARQIEQCAGLSVERRFHLGGTLLAHQAMRNGQIDVYPEYTGTALMTVLKETPSGGKDTVFDRVRAVYMERYDIEWMGPLGFENTFAMAVPSALANQHGWRTLSDAARSGFAFRLGVGYEFEQRADGLPGLLKTYPLRLNGPPRAMDLGLLYKAIEQNQVDMVAGSSTDGMIAAMRLRALEDDQRYFPPYEAALVVRTAVLRSQPRLRPCLDGLGQRIREDAVREANRNVDLNSWSIESAAMMLMQSKK